MNITLNAARKHGAVIGQLGKNYKRRLVLQACPYHNHKQNMKQKICKLCRKIHDKAVKCNDA